jgi:hypothetical protein
LATRARNTTPHEQEAELTTTMATTPNQPPLLRDVINIKPQISTSDFVLKLADAVTEEGAARALQDYVITDRLVENFNEALGFISTAHDLHTSKAIYLHGSFGSGKSHFMAVLHALLHGNPSARGRKEFDSLLRSHSELLETASKDRGFLLVPYHMLEAKSLEQRVLGGYVKHIQALHPEATTPQVYRTDSLFENIQRLRQNIGDEEFIAKLGDESAVEVDEWGEGFIWTNEKLDAALASAQADADETLNLVTPTTGPELRAKLVHDALQGWFPGFFSNAREDEHGFVSMGDGLNIIATHAKSLGYRGLILFLDELILWLANHIHDQKFVSREADKMTSFVEDGNSRRALPIVSFIARQRDLRELVGEELSGAAELAIQDTLKLASGRFDVITLEDRNLPVIANKRLLQPKDDHAAQLIEDAFAKVRRVGPQVWDILLGSDEGTTGADEASFRLTYPFSPAFMDTLVHISSALQRSRTGLKLMGQLLADHRDDARLEQLIPLGDLYPVIARGGDEPFVEKLKAEFKEADKLYRTKLRPYLLGAHDLTEEDVEEALHRPDRDTAEGKELLARYNAFAGDNRLICTLLLSALAPGVPELKDLTVRRLAALNHGSITSPIPGAEVGVVTAKVSEWASRFAEIKETGTTANRGVRLELAGVDVDSVIANANVNNNPGNRKALLRRLLSEEMGISSEGRLTGDELQLIWLGTQRTVEVVIGNIVDKIELPDHEFSPSQDGAWRFVIDLPYDEGSYGPVEDANRIRDLRELPGERPQTVAWIPAHFSKARFQDFQRLVTIDYALADAGRFATQYASHLNADNRARAKGLLEGQRASLTKTIKVALKQAYGLGSKKPADVALDYDEHLIPLPEIPELKLSIGQSLHDAARHVAAKLLDFQFPGHPDLDRDRSGTAVRLADARQVFAHIKYAADQADRRVEVPAKDRGLLRRIAEPLHLGVQKEAYFELSRHWVDHFNDQARLDGVTSDLPVVRLTSWLDRPNAMGLAPFLANLVIASFAELDGRVWVRNRAVLRPAPDVNTIQPNDALRLLPLPSERDWDEARRRFEGIFGKPAPNLRRGPIIDQFSDQVVAEAHRYQSQVEGLVQQLEKHQDQLGLDDAAVGGRLDLARRSLLLLAGLAELDRGSVSATGIGKKVVEHLAEFNLGGISAQRLGVCIKQAEKVTVALGAEGLEFLQLVPACGANGQAVLDVLRAAAQVDELTASLPDALQRAKADLYAMLKRTQPSISPNSSPEPTPAQGPASVVLGTPTSQPPLPNEQPTPPRRRGARSGGARTTAARAVAELRTELEELATLEPDSTIEISWRVVE